MYKVQLGDFKMHLHGDNYLEKKIIETGQWEPETTRVFQELVTPDMVVLDIGANIGYFSLLSASLVGPNGQVHAFEPYPGYQERFCQSLAMNEFSNIRLLPFALSDKVEEHELHKGLSSTRMHKWTPENPVFNKIHDTVNVKCLPLDHYASENLTQVDVIKIDVDGYEMHVLRGGYKTIQKYKPVIIIELFEEALRDAGTSVKELLDFFESLGYDPFSEQGQLFTYKQLHQEAVRDLKLSLNVVFRPHVEANSSVDTSVRTARPFHKLKAGLVIDLPFHEQDKWVSATTPHLVEGLRRVFDCVIIQTQEDYEARVGQIDVLVSMEPGWAAPKLDFVRTDELRMTFKKIPSYILYSDPHSQLWREDYFIDNGFDYILSYYYYPFRHHFRRIKSNQIIHFPWAIPDGWIGNRPLSYYGNDKINCFGASKSNAYSVRNWCRSFDYVDFSTNSGCENKVMTEDAYIQWLGTKDACIAAGSDDPMYRLTVPKYFEIAAAGVLLFAQETDDLSLLGFEHQKNCIIFNRSNFDLLAREYLKRPQAYLGIRHAGRELIRNRHSLSGRLNRLYNHVLEAKQRKNQNEDCTSHRLLINTPSPTLSKIGEGKPEILFIVDSPDWAHDFKTNNIIRSISTKYQCVKKFCDTVNADDIESADLIVLYYWKQLLKPGMKPLIPTLQQNRHKVLMGVCSHGELQGRWRQAGIEAIEQTASAVFVNSKLIFDEFRDCFTLPMYYTPNGVDTKFFTPTKKSQQGGSLIVGWAGSLKNHGNVRGYHDYIEPAVERVDGVELRVAAREDKWRNAEEMRAFYQQIDVYICASQYEGTPNTCLEAMACGVPVLTTRVGNMPELIQNGVNGYMIDRSIDDIVQKLNAIKSDPVRLKTLGRQARADVEQWDWRIKSGNYEKMFDAFLASSGEKNLFQSQQQVYLASADRMDNVLANVITLKQTPKTDRCEYISVVGGLSGLNYLLSVQPRQITFFDLNVHATAYARMLFEVIGFSRNRDDFMSRIFGRSVEAFKAKKGLELNIKTQGTYLKESVDMALLEDTISRLSDPSRLLYRDFLRPYQTRGLLDGVRNCRLLLPCFGIHERVPVGGGKDCGYNEQKQLVPNTNSFFYGHGWLQSDVTFYDVQRKLKETPIRFVPFNLLKGDLDILADFSNDVVLHVSNIDDWFPEQWPERVAQMFQTSLEARGRLTLISTQAGVTTADHDSHAKAYAAVAPYVYGDVVEVTHKVPWGFHEFERQNVFYKDYLSGNFPAHTTILHILVGEGLSVEVLWNILEKAVACSRRVILMEHAADSNDWERDKKSSLLSIAQIERLLDEVAKRHQVCVLPAMMIPGQRDLMRNVQWIIDCSTAVEKATEPLQATVKTPSNRAQKEYGRDDVSAGYLPGQNRQLTLSSGQSDATSSPNYNAVKLFHRAQNQFALGNMVTAQRIMNDYKTQIDYDRFDVTYKPSRKKDPFMSVILVTYNRPDDLGLCIESLRKQQYQDFEIIVIDNSDDDKKSLRFSGQVDVYVNCETNFNLSEGRNIGAHFARGQVLVLLDDDALVGPEYLESISRAFNRCEILGLRGRAYPKTQSQQNRHVEVYDLGDKAFPTFCNQEGNSAFLLSAYRQVGGMDPLLFGHEGSELTYRLMKTFNRPNAVIYWPETVIYHDYGTPNKFRKKQEVNWQNLLYIRYKHGIHIFGIKKQIEKLSVQVKGQAKVSLPRFDWPQVLSQPVRISLQSPSDTPQVSVVMSCYNAAEYLRPTLDSICGQTMKAWELIAVDDGSNDATMAILDEYTRRDSRIRVCRFEDNQGPYVRRNFAIAKSRAAFISIQDSDDIMAANKLEVLYEQINRDDRLGIVGSFYRRFVDEFSGPEYGDRMEKQITHDELMSNFQSSWHLCWHGSAIIRKSLFDAIGLYDSQPYGSDTFWLSKAGLYGLVTGKVRFMNIPEYLTFKREHSASQTGRISPADPRSRRHRLEVYYLQKLRTIFQKVQQGVSMDIEQELQACSCSDFIPTFGRQFSQWESQPLTPEQIFKWLGKASDQIENGQFASALISLNQLDMVTEDIQKEFVGFDLFRGLAYFVQKQDKRAIGFFEREYRSHESGYALWMLKQYQTGYISEATDFSQRQEIVDMVLHSDNSGGDGVVCGYLMLCLSLVKYAIKNGLHQKALVVYEHLLGDKKLLLSDAVKQRVQTNIFQLKQQIALAKNNPQNMPNQTILL